MATRDTVCAVQELAMIALAVATVAAVWWGLAQRRRSAPDALLHAAVRVVQDPCGALDGDLRWLSVNDSLALSLIHI